jgi:hypothetical protein
MVGDHGAKHCSVPSDPGLGTMVLSTALSPHILLVAHLPGGRVAGSAQWSEHRAGGLCPPNVDTSRPSMSRQKGQGQQRPVWSHL